MGRKAETPYNGQRVSVEICIGQDDVRFLRSLGGGNLSEGTRRAIAMVSGPNWTEQVEAAAAKEDADVGVPDG